LLLNVEKQEPMSNGTFLQANMSRKIAGELKLVANFKEVNPVNGILINEVSAKNELITDNHGEFDDWIELYNPNNGDVDLSKVFIEFDGYKKISQKLSKSDICVLKPGEHKLFWADGEIDEGANHLPFELFGEGETIRLYQPVGPINLVLDSFKVGAKYPKATIGRYPDGANSWVYMNKTTPGEINEYKPMEVKEMSGDAAFEIYPNPAKGIVNIVIPENVNTKIMVDILTDDGRNLMSETITGSPYKINLTGLIDGLYLIRLKIGKRFSFKKILVIN
jgi:hypothetical protein